MPYLFLVLLLSACLSAPPPPPTIIKVPAPPLPVAQLLASIDANPIDPILAQGESFEVRRSDLVRLLLLEHGSVGLQDLVRREAAIQRIRRLGIEISAAQVEARAREILQANELSLQEYLSSRSIERVTWVNEISVLLGMEQLCRHEMILAGALRVRYALFDTRQQAEAFRFSAKDQSEWLSPFMVSEAQLRQILFDPQVPAIFSQGNRFWVLEVLEKIEPTSRSAADFQNHLEKLEDWQPTRARLEQFLDHLISLDEVTFTLDRLYHDLDNKVKE